MVEDIRIPSLKDEGKSDSSIFEVEDWFKMVCAGNNSEDDVKAFMVQQLDWYKNRVGFRHEYLVATTYCPKNSRIYLRFERRSTSEQLKKARLINVVGDENKKSLSNKDRKVARQALDDERKLTNVAKGAYFPWFSNLAPSSSVGSTLRAADHVMQVRNPLMLNDDPSDGAYLMITYNNFQNPFSLRDLAIIAHGISKDSPSYNAMTEQCYWFVRTIVGVATDLYGPATPIKTNQSDRAGKFVIRSVNRNTPLQIENFVKKVTESIEADNSKIAMIWKDGRGGRLDAERQRDQAEQDKAKAEALAVEAAEARAEAEARADAESKAREAETKARLEVEAHMRAMEEELARYRKDTEYLPRSVGSIIDLPRYSVYCAIREKTTNAHPRDRKRMEWPRLRVTLRYGGRIAQKLFAYIGFPNIHGAFPDIDNGCPDIHSGFPDIPAVPKILLMATSRASATLKPMFRHHWPIRHKQLRWTSCRLRGDLRQQSLRAG
ncbi:hypothetical protein CPC08DRAFT_728673 [Agrocybe pediades]|nr:hypothetical protein CPC08DRAFT_728673 [Agrocybe pediades]